MERRRGISRLKAFRLKVLNPNSLKPASSQKIGRGLEAFSIGRKCQRESERSEGGHSQKIVPGLEASTSGQNVKPGPERSEGPVYFSVPSAHSVSSAVKSLSVSANGNSLPKVSIFFHDVSREFPCVSMRRKGSRASAGGRQSETASRFLRLSPSFPGPGYDGGKPKIPTMFPGWFHGKEKD
jgi:hypothetical protein